MSSNYSGKRFLIVDDVEFNILLLGEIFEDKYIEVEFATNGKEAIDLVQSNNIDYFDLVLMDIEMPVMDGYEATQHISRIAPNLPIIGLSANTSEEVKTRCRSVGMIDYITKPFNINELFHDIDRHIGNTATEIDNELTTIHKTSKSPDDSDGETLQEKITESPEEPDGETLQEKIAESPEEPDGEILQEKVTESPEEPDGETLQEKLDALKNRFFNELFIYKERVNSLWNGYCETKDKQKLSELVRHVHSLAGTSPTFGFQEVGSAAKNLEQKLRLSIEASEELTDIQLVVIKSDFHKLESAIDLAIPENKCTKSDISVSRESRDRSILLMDDDPILVEYLSAQLRNAGYDVHSFTKLSLLKEALEYEQVSAIIMDMVLPEGKFAGADFIQELRKTQSLAIPVIFISSQNDMQSRIAAVRAGADDYLTKPLSLEKMIDVLDKLTSSSRDHHILVIEDDNAQAAYTQVILDHAGFKVTTLSDPSEVIDKLETIKPDLVLMDMHLPNINGIELTSLIRQFDEWKGLPIIFLSSETDPLLQHEAIKKGGDVFLQKTIEPKLLIESIQLRLNRETTRQVTSLMPTESSITERDNFLNELNKVLLNKDKSSVIIVELNETEKLRDTFGLRGLDEIMAEMEELFRKYPTQRIAYTRLGDNSFALLTPISDKENLLRQANDLTQRLLDLSICINSQKISLSFSIGIAKSMSGLSVIEIINRADTAAKIAHKKDRIHLYDPESDTYISNAEDVKIIQRLNEDIFAKRIFSVFQPIYNTKMDVVIYDVFARIGQQDGDYLMPSEFLQIAESSGIMMELDLKVIEHSFSQIANNPHHLTSTRFMLNLSNEVLLRKDFSKWFQQMQQKHGVQDRNFIVKLTIPNDADKLKQYLESISVANSMNLPITVADAINNKSHLRMLKHIRPKYVRLNYDLVQSAVLSNKNRNTVKQFVNILHKLGCKIMAGKIENAVILGEVWKLDFDYFQGNFTHAPHDTIPNA